MENLESLAYSLSRYSTELHEKNKAMKLVHTFSIPWHSLSEGLDVFYLGPVTRVINEQVQMLASKIIEAGPYPFINLDEYSPVDAKKRYLFIKEVKNGAQVPTILLTYSPGNNVGNSHFIWHKTLSTASSQRVIEEIKTKLPIFHSRLMKREVINKFGKVSSSVKPAVLRYFYHDLTGDSSGSETMNQEEVDLHAKQAIEIEDFEIVADLRHLNYGNKTKYDVFWDECGKFLEQNIGTAVDDRRHIGITHSYSNLST